MRCVKCVKCDKMKGQVATEALVIIGFILFLLIPFSFMLFSRINELKEGIIFQQTENAIDSVLSGVSSVYAIGPNSSAVIDVYFNKAIKEINITPGEKSEIVMSLDTSIGKIDFVRVFPSNVNGTIGAGEGMKKIKIVYSEKDETIYLSEK